MKKITTQNCKGQAIVETAFVLMIIMLFTFAITEFGRAMYIKNMLNNAARAGARQAVVTGSVKLLPLVYATNSFPLADTTTTKNIIGTKISDSLMYVNKAQVTATVTCGSDPTTSACSGADPTTAKSGDTITVVVTSPYEPFIKLFKNAITNQLVGAASMRYE